MLYITYTWMLDAGINCTILALVVNNVVPDDADCCDVTQSDNDVDVKFAATPTWFATSPTPNGSKLELPFSSTILSIATPPYFCKNDNAGSKVLHGW